MYILISFLIILLIVCSNYIFKTKDRFQTTNNIEMETENTVSVEIETKDTDCSFEEITSEEYEELNPTLKSRYDFNKTQHAILQQLQNDSASLTSQYNDATQAKQFLCDEQNLNINTSSCRRLSSDIRQCINDTQMENCQYNSDDLRCKYSDVINNKLVGNDCEASNIGNCSRYVTKPRDFLLPSSHNDSVLKKIYKYLESILSGDKLTSEKARIANSLNSCRDSYIISNDNDKCIRLAESVDNINNIIDCNTATENLVTASNVLLANKRNVLLKKCECSKCASYTNKNRDIKCMNDCSEDEINRLLTETIRTENNNELLTYLNENQEVINTNNMVSNSNNMVSNTNNMVSNTNNIVSNTNNMVSNDRGESISELIPNAINNNNHSSFPQKPPHKPPQKPPHKPPLQIRKDNKVSLLPGNEDTDRLFYGISDYERENDMNLKTTYNDNSLANRQQQGKSDGSLGYGQFLPNIDYDIYLEQNRGIGMQQTHYDGPHPKSNSNIPLSGKLDNALARDSKTLITQSEIDGVTNIFAPNIVINPPQNGLLGGSVF